MTKNKAPQAMLLLKALEVTSLYSKESDGDEDTEDEGDEQGDEDDDDADEDEHDD